MAQIDFHSKPSEAVARLFPGKPVTDPETQPGWPRLEAALFGETHAAVPGFPLEALPAPWRTWIGDTATSVNVPIDYVAQAVLAAVAGVCGAGVWVRVSPVWSSPLSLWLAVVGAPSSGKSPALASVRRLLRILEGADDPDARIVAGGSLEAVLDATRTNQRGVILWRDEPEGCFAPLPGGGGVRELDPYPVAILGALEPDRLPSTLQRTLHRGEATVAARFLYAVPAPPPFQPLAGRKPARDDDALALLRTIRGKAGTMADPLYVHVDDDGLAALDRFLGNLHADLCQAEGLLAAWLGKGRGVVPKLASVLHLLDWSARQMADPSAVLGDLGRDAIERAIAMWSGYYRVHAKAFFDRTAPSDLEARVRSVVRWLRSCGLDQVSREDVRRTALGQAVNACEADRVLARLTEAGVLRPIALQQPAQRGRPERRWEVNPALREA
ncbi:DUF3987 domain-containing protein [Reyranella soli]|uniref:DUF3987 domain-containing protein n=1 Tax=Reyranella soli TaxID=1230389 RepID=A0A512NPD9_9HYPH|nr:DUF3987 domain-containing protein [Reyranella soli]GEP60814.1 hypothetical protein RSO01_79800 [Reyranella soli]